jgi:large conductance mechanosensitive channel
LKETDFKVNVLAKEDEMLEELKKIRTLLEPKPAPAAPAPKGLLAEFMDFISKYKVLGLAVGFIMGLYLGNLVQALVKDFLLPAIGLAIPGMKDMATYAVTVMSQIFGVGDFLVALITFIIVAFVVFLIVKIAKRWGME